ncbi:MAG: NAD(P)H-dependent oxidoreductase subunit E [Thermodesulfovibrionales bacterium]|nr:NAD(P)H-dependent oxidoreductase subunit E [Thermodesulfovibrionales bacterium]
MQKDINILVVDDEPVVINSCERVLREEGYNVHSAMRGKDAIHLMEENIYNLLLTDLKMPEMDGISLIEWTRKSKPSTGIVVITGYPSQQSIQDVLGLGCIDYVPKPFTPVMLTDVTYRALELAKKTPPLEDFPVGDFTPEMALELNSIINNYKNMPGNLIPVLQKAQEIVGYLPPEVQKQISSKLKVPVAEIHSVVSFYSFFTMKQRGKHLIRVCEGTACYVKRVSAVLDKLISELDVKVGEMTTDRKFSLESVRCLGACGLAPVMMIDQSTHGAMTPMKVVEVLDTYKQP